jgi:aryl sulfotransferase
MSDAVWPTKTRDVLNHHQDSSNWDLIALREGDVVAANWAKAGVTWLQQIVVQLIHDGSPDAHAGDRTLWPDWWMDNPAEMAAVVAAVPGRRVFKTHLPADALTISPEARYIYIGRDARDVAWSFYNHVHTYSQWLIDRVNAAPHRDWARDWPDCSDDIRVFYREWIEKDGHPYWPFWSHVQSWWDLRHLPNVMLLHFEQLKRDREGQMRRIAAFIGAEPTAAGWPRILEHCSFEWMKANPGRLFHLDAFRDRGASFINKGVGGRWREVLSPEEIALADDAAAANLSPECARWLATGEGA